MPSTGSATVLLCTNHVHWPHDGIATVSPCTDHVTEPHDAMLSNVSSVSSAAPICKPDTLLVVLQAPWTALRSGPAAFTEPVFSSCVVVNVPATLGLTTLACIPGSRKILAGTAQHSTVRCWGDTVSKAGGGVGLLTLAKALCCWAWQLAWASSLATTLLRRASASSAAWIRSLSPTCINASAHQRQVRGSWQAVQSG